MWQVINSLRKKRDDDKYEFNADGFNAYFTSITNTNVKQCDIFTSCELEPKFIIKPINTFNLYNLWKGLKKKPNPSPDNHGFALKMLSYTISSPNVHEVLCNLII